MAGSEHQSLGLYMGQQHVATVHFEYTRIHRFEYTQQWREQGFALSPHLPLHGPASEKAANLFLRNMFPEGTVFDKALQYLAISKENHFAILSTLGLEAPGSLALAAKPGCVERKSTPFSRRSTRQTQCHETPHTGPRLCRWGLGIYPLAKV